MLAGAGALHKPVSATHQSYIWYSDDGRSRGRDWGQAIPIGDPNYWIWRIVWHNEAAYGIGYRTGGGKGTRLYKSTDGLHFEPLVPQLTPPATNKNYPNDKPAIYVDHGYTVAKVFLSVVEKACKNGDLTRDGVLKAFHDTNGLDTQGLTGALHYSLVGRPSSTQSYVTKVDRSAPGGLTTVEELFESELVKAKGTRAK